MTIDYKAQAEEFAAWLVGLADGKGKRRRHGDVVRGRCPKPGHPDKNPSFSFDVGKNAWACSCGQGKGSELQAALGWIPAAERPEKPASKTKVAAIPKREPDEVYAYDGGNRKLKWRTLGQKSQSAWRHQDGTWSMKGAPGLYKLADAAASDRSLPVGISESESDVDALWKLGLPAIATPFGANVPLKEIPRELAGRRLVTWEHRDIPGRKYAAAMSELGVAIARPLEPHKDVRDWIGAGAKKDEVLAEARAAIGGPPPPEKATDLMNAVIPDLDYIIRPLIAVGNLTLLQGEPKGGKSCFALLVAICAALGIWRSDRWSASSMRPRRTLFITWEDGRRRVKKRIGQYLNGLMDAFKPLYPDELLVYAKDTAPRFRLEDAGSAAKLLALVKEHAIEFVVVDTLSHVSAADENSKQEMQPVMDALTDLAHSGPCAVLLVHHASKPPKEANGRSVAYRGRGSGAISAAADAILDWGTREGNLTSCSFISKDDDSDAFLVEYLPDGDDTVAWKLTDPPEEVEDKYASKKLIIESLSKAAFDENAPVSIQRVVKECGLPRSTVQRTLRSLADEGSIQKVQVKGPHGEQNKYAPCTFTPRKDGPNGAGGVPGNDAGHAHGQGEGVPTL